MPFKITPAAKERVVRALSDATSKRRTIQFVEATDIDSAVASALPDAFNQSASAETRALAFDSIPEHLGDDVRLVAAVFDDMWYLPWDLVTVDGIRFFLPLRLRLRVGNGLLDVAGKSLILMDANGEMVLPRKKLLRRLQELKEELKTIKRE